MKQTEMFYDWLSTSHGELKIVADQTHILSIGFFNRRDADGKPNSITLLAKNQLTAYFDQQLTEFDLPIAWQGTEFQNQVWQTLTTIPWGETWSYERLANEIKNPKAVRAVGSANGKNPIAIVVPCHRVIGKNGKLTGYAGGLDRKSWLLELESLQPSFL